MSASPGVVKFPSSAADQPDYRFCGQCGRLCQPLLNYNVGFGACIEDADSPIDCRDLRRAIVASYTIAKWQDQDVHPDTVALVKRLGIPQSLVEQWVAKAERVQGARNELRQMRYGPPSFVTLASDWISKDDSGDRLLALIEELRTALDPTHGGDQRLTWGEISEWYERLGKRAHEILSDPGDWETSE